MKKPSNAVGISGFSGGGLEGAESCSRCSADFLLSGCSPGFFLSDCCPFGVETFAAVPCSFSTSLVRTSGWEGGLLVGVDFGGVDFEGVDFESVDFESVDFEGVDFEGLA